MSPVKTTVMVLVIGAILFSIYLIIVGNLFSVGIRTPINENKNSSEKSATKHTPLVIKYPFHKSLIQWLKNELASPFSPSIQKEEITQPKISQDINSKLQDLFSYIDLPEQSNDIKEEKNNSLNSSLITQKPDSKSVGDYYKSFIDIALKVNFSNEELALLKKDNDGKRALLLEELIENAAGGADLNELRSSFSAWHQLDERILAELKKYPVNNEISSIHKSLTDWFSYHSSIAKLLNEENLSVSQINQLQKEFRDKAKTHTIWFGESLTKLKKSPDFAFIPKAQAITCGAVVPPPFYHFGGRVLFMFPCNWGIVETISLPCGGLLLFTYPVLVANPYLWKKPTIGSAVLGRSTIFPGICPLGVCPACVLYPYEAVVLYFGTSGLP